jgi:hypothetical protein
MGMTTTSGEREFVEALQAEADGVGCRFERFCGEARARLSQQAQTLWQCTSTIQHNPWMVVSVILQASLETPPSHSHTQSPVSTLAGFPGLVARSPVL